jgi:hypothetical protein
MMVAGTVIVGIGVAVTTIVGELSKGAGEGVSFTRIETARLISKTNTRTAPPKPIGERGRAIGGVVGADAAAPVLDATSLLST